MVAKAGKNYGGKARLSGKLEYLWYSGSGVLSEQTDLFRLTFALETAKAMNWIYCLLSEREWTGRNAVSMNPDMNGIYICRSALAVAFDEDGKQVTPLKVRITGNIPPFEMVFRRCGWRIDDEINPEVTHLYSLITPV
ncbi:hypothetical protein E05_51140 [Plautia stali symbiont]|nr:hypothetical protein E05_51140 [Plautia stali symbiont]